MIERGRLIAETLHSIRTNPVTALLGPRQCGKTTLAREIGIDAAFFDLEDPISLRRLTDARLTLSPLRGLIVLDEIQRRPELFPILRVLADRKPLRARFLILGSASPELLQQSSESLAGRISFVELGGFGLEEVPADLWKRLWMRGGFPRAFLTRTEADSASWKESFIRTFLERDIRDLGVEIPASRLRALWTMVAHYHGQLWNASEISRSLGEAHTTVKRHLDVLTGALVVRQLTPWFVNVSKRQIKSPKIYVRDSGLLHHLLGIKSFVELQGHPKLGASWEGFVVEEAARIVGSRNMYFWGSQSGAELDIFLPRASGNIGIEVKYADAPGVTKSMRIAMQDLGLKRLLVVYPGDEPYDLDTNIRVIPVQSLREELSGKRSRRS